VAQHAFWDALADGLRAEAPQWERLVVLLEEVRGILMDIIPQGSGDSHRLRASLAEKLDMVCAVSIKACTHAHASL
jgi:hypothetical protein